MPLTADLLRSPLWMQRLPRPSRCAQVLSLFFRSFFKVFSGGQMRHSFPQVFLRIGIGAVCFTACATSRESTAPPPAVAGAAEPVPAPEAEPESSDPRVGLRSGWFDAEEVEWNMSLVSESRPAPELTPSTAGDFNFMNSDMAFMGNYLI